MTVEEISKELTELLKVISIKEVDHGLRLEHLGKMIDFSSIVNKIDGTEKAISLTEEFLEITQDETELALGNFFLSNALNDKWKFSKPKGNNFWVQNWDDPFLEKIILCLRKARFSKAFDMIPEGYKYSILHNLGNILDTVGRPISAIEYFNAVLELEPCFSMARGNRALAESLYSRALYDSGHQMVFTSFFKADLESTLSDPLKHNLHHGSELVFSDYLDVIDEFLSKNKLDQSQWNLYDHSLGDSFEEVSYRTWCLKNNLFLNPLNDLGAFPIAAADILHLPSHTTDVDIGPKFFGAFNQIKQSYTSARFLFFDSLTYHETHFSDKKVLLYDTLDYPNYSIRIEKLKMSFRLLYGTFDQIAFFLNDYLELGFQEHEVSFSKIWYKGTNKKKKFNLDIKERKNSCLQGLFWISKDLFENNDDFNRLVNPDAKDLREIRNCLEHRYLKVHEYYLGKPENKISSSVWFDDLAYSIEENALVRKTFHLVKLVREAVIYTSLAMKFEDLSKSNDPNRIVFPNSLNPFDDDFKV